MGDPTTTGRGWQSKKAQMTPDGRRIGSVNRGTELARARQFVDTLRAKGESEAEIRRGLIAGGCPEELATELCPLAKPKRRSGLDIDRAVDRPSLLKWGRLLFGVSCIVLIAVVGLLGRAGYTTAANVMAVASCFILGFAMIALSRVLMAGDWASALIRLAVFRYWFANAPSGPWVARLLGSMLVGWGVFGIAYLRYVPHYSPRVAGSSAIICGALGGLAVWVVTMFVFRRYEEE